VSSFDARALGRVPGVALSVVGYRNQSRGYDPRSGDGARRQGGRFNPPHSFPVLYLCLTKPCAVAELTRLAQRQSLRVEDLLPRELWQVEAELDNVLDLTESEVLVELGFSIEDLVREDHQFTHEIGEAAHEHGFQAIRSASATGVDRVLAVLPERLAGAVLEVELVGEWTTAQDLLR
jgi:RES domain-containing protein